MKKTILIIIIFAITCVNMNGQGPVIISGLDTEYGLRPTEESHGSITLWATIIRNGIINNLVNRQCNPIANKNGNILVIGGGKGPYATDEMTNFWTQIGNHPLISKGITFVNGATNITNQSFNGFSMIVICNSSYGIGLLSNAEYTAICNRKNDITNFIVSGGGFFASSCEFNPKYDFFNMGNLPVLANHIGWSNSIPTPLGTSMGILTIQGPFHNSFSQWPSFLSVLSTINNQPVIIGGTAIVPSFCLLPCTIEIGTGTSYTSSSQLQSTYGTNISSLNFRVKGDFNINSNITFSNCKFRCDPGSGIINGSSLTLNNSSIKSCDTLWKGIFVQNNAIMNINNSKIEDAHIAIEYQGNASTSLINDTFLNNVIGIFYQNNEVFSKNKSSNLLQGNIFTATLGINLKSKYNGFTSNITYNIQNNQPNIIPKPFAGIMAYDIDRFDIDNPITAPSNVFSNMTNGIIAYKVKNATINYSNFDNISSIIGNSNKANGVGIYYYSGITDHDLYWTNNGLFKSIGFGRNINTFNNCTKGIYAEQCSNNIQNQNMNGMSIGLDIINSFSRDITNNHIAASNYCIKINCLTICPSYSINNNQLFLNASNEAYSAIHIDNQTTEWCKHTFNNISSNCISTSGIVGFGISTNNITNTAANLNSCNSISINSPSTSLGGILANNCYSVHTDNFIFGTSRTTQSSKGGLAGAYPVAIHTNASYGDAYYNQYNNILVGMRYSGNCSPSGGRETLIYQNRFQDLTIGFRFDFNLTLNDFEFELSTPYGTPPVKYNFGNEFNGTITTKAYTPLGNSQFPKIMFNTSSSIYNPNPSFPLGAFSDLNSHPNYPPSSYGSPNTVTCGTQGLNNCEFPRPIRTIPIFDDPELKWTKLRISILDKTLDFSSYATAMIWQNELKLYNELKPLEASFADTSLEKLFLVEKESENMDEIAALTQAEASLLSPDDNTIDVIRQTIDNIQHNIDSLTIVYDTIHNNLKSSIATEIDAEKSALNSTNMALQSAINHEVIERDRISDSLKIQNDRILATMPTDSFQLAYNSIFYNKYAKGDYNLSSEQIATMQYLANQCPFINEKVVFKARSAYHAYNDSIYYNDSMLCTQKGFFYKSAGRNVSKDNSLRFSLSPNPVIDNAILRWNTNSNSSLILFITDIQGRVFANQMIDPDTNQYVIETQNWASGLYFVQVYKDKKCVHSSRLLIRKP